jgi:hypothetical protein
MKRSPQKNVAVFLFLFALALGAAFWWVGQPPAGYEWNQKLTVSIDTPEGEKSGSAVQHVRWTTAPLLLREGRDGPSAGGTVIGEAAMVDLGGGKYLFALLSGTRGLWGNAETIASFAFWGMDKAAGTQEGLEYLTALPEGSRAVLEPDNYPLLVTFDDINDPKTVKRVDPANLEASFGLGVRLKEISLEMTGDVVSKGNVESKLGWIRDYYAKMFDGQLLRNAAATTLTANSLSQTEFLRD